MNMRHIARAAGVIGFAWAGMAGPGAQAAGIGTTFGIPHIIGVVKPGELAEVKSDLSGHFDKPLTLRVDPASSPLEVMRIGLWLREQQPAIKLRADCVGACAWFMLDSGRSLEVAKDVVIAFGMLPEIWANIGEQLDAGAVSIDDARSSASVTAFKAKIPATVWAASGELRQARRSQARAPAWIQEFVEGSTSFWITQLTHDEERFHFELKSTPQRCVWWVPDAEGLRQLGLAAPGYAPATAARAARVLGVSEKLIYVGPALREPPATPMCEGDPNFQLKVPRT
ncbi:hypothetical protein [Roseateles chitosanitabidus]|uniref:hypothetical protein n=1 Tax=Roseateles chitosanitabidus TaxID=65048 RepID=UPI0008359B9B|nr:hypothetical protein [Roseateles chitosanitabidus]